MSEASTLITGAAGFAGRHLLALLTTTQPRHRLVAWSRRVHAAGHAAVEWQQVDLTDRDAVTRAVLNAQPDRIVHLAGTPHVGQSWHDSALPLRTNALGTHYLLEAVRRHRPRCRVLVVTSAMIYRASADPLTEDSPVGPASPYGFSKLAQDQLALAAAQDDGLDVVVARPFNHVGPGQDASFFLPGFARQIACIEAGLAPARIRVGNLESRRDLTDVRDVADAYVRLLESGVAGQAYNICTGHAYRIGDLLDRLVARSRVPVTREIDSARLRPSDMPLLVGSNARLRREVGWQPRHSIDATLGDTLQEWRSAVAGGRIDR